MYKSQCVELPGTSYEEIIKLARHEYHIIQKRTPRRVPYVRSKYFTKDKIFINNFWNHLKQKSPRDRVRRLKLFTCAIDLIRNGQVIPYSYQATNNANEILHRFYGETKDSKLFCVQIKENKKTGRKDFISVFPSKQSKK